MRVLKVLVTGAGGYIGSISTHELLKSGFKVVAIDNFTTGYKEPLEILQKKFGKRRFRFYELDLSSPIDSFFQKERGIDAVIHYAASCSVDESMRKPQKYFSNNVYSTNNLLLAMKKNNLNKIVFSSTCAVYGDADYVPVDERHPTKPGNPYGESKKMSEDIIKWYGKLLNLNYVILRYFNVCGASDNGVFGDSKKPSTLLVQNAVRSALGIETFYLTCPTVNTKDKTPIRDYINVVDLSNAHIKAVKYLINGGKNEIINLGSGDGNSVLEVVKQVQMVTDKTFNIKSTKARKGEYAIMLADIRKAKRVLKWKPERDIKDSIESLVVWYKNNPRGWKY